VQGDPTCKENGITCHPGVEKGRTLHFWSATPGQGSLSKKKQRKGREKREKVPRKKGVRQLKRGREPGIKVTDRKGGEGGKNPPKQQP